MGLLYFCMSYKQRHSLSLFKAVFPRMFVIQIALEDRHSISSGAKVFLLSSKLKIKSPCREEIKLAYCLL